MKTLIYSWIIILFCATQLKAQQPEWVASLAIDPEYYIGISSCDKTVPDYQSVAMKRALSLIAEQIQVTVSSSNELYTSEHNFNFNQDFTQTIKTTSNITLQDYELYQSWEDSTSYFVYYRLSKQLFRDNLSKTYDIALENCTVKTNQADSLLASYKIIEALNSYLDASKFLEPVISNSFIADKYAMVVNRWNGIQSRLLTMLFDFQVRPQKEKLQLTKGKMFSIPFSVETIYTAEGKDVKLSGLPVVFELSGNLNAFESKVINSDNQGIAQNHIVNIYNESLAYTINCRIDFDSFLSRHKDYQVLTNPEFENLLSNCKILIEVIPITVVINSEEYTYSNKNSSPVIKNELGNYLRTQNIAILDNEKKSDYIINLNADTRQGNCYNDVCSAFIDVEYKVFKNSSDSLLLNGNMEPVKGLSLSFESAASQAYKNVKEEIKPKLGRVILPYLK